MLIIHPIFPLVKLVPVLSDKTVHLKKKKKDSSIIFALTVSEISRLWGVGQEAEAGSHK